MRTQLEYSGVALEEWVRFSARLLNLCEQILHTSDIPPDQKGFADPRILALALLCRTHGNFRGVILTAKEGLIVEERTLARPCYENMFLVAGLVEKGDAFVAAMYDHEARSVRSRAEFLLDDLDTLNPLAMDVQAASVADSRAKKAKTQSEATQSERDGRGQRSETRLPVLQPTVRRRCASFRGGS